LTDCWRLLQHFDAEPGFNMAVDEQLLLGGSSMPTLRFYTWKPDALSLGYFQRWVDVPAAEEASIVVRRLTGGGAIHHARELTFSLTAPLDHPLYRGPVRESYERVHRAIAMVLADYGARASLRGEQVVTSDVPETGMCFHKSTDLDLIWDAGKGLGSAQRRTAGRVLHHGSLKLGTTELETGIASLESHAPELEPEELARALQAAFPELLGMKLERGELAPSELDRAQSRSNHFRSSTFLHRR